MLFSKNDNTEKFPLAYIDENGNGVVANRAVYVVSSQDVRKYFMRLDAAIRKFAPRIDELSTEIKKGANNVGSDKLDLMKLRLSRMVAELNEGREDGPKWLSYAKSMTTAYIEGSYDKKYPLEFSSWQKEVNSWCTIIGINGYYETSTETSNDSELDKPFLDDDDDGDNNICKL